MRNEILKITLAIAVVCVAIYNVYSTQGKKPLSELAKANVEALASGESSAGYFKATESTVVSSQETPYATIIYNN